MALVAHGSNAVVWHDIDEDEKFPVVGISSVVISWFFSPIASGLVAAFFFRVARTLILRSERSYERTFWFLPVLVFICIFINAFYVLDKGITKQWDWIKDHIERSAWIAAVIAAACFIITIFISIWLKKQLDADHANKEAADMDAEKNGGVAEKGVLHLTFILRRGIPFTSGSITCSVSVHSLMWVVCRRGGSNVILRAPVCCYQLQ